MAPRVASRAVPGNPVNASDLDACCAAVAAALLILSFVAATALAQQPRAVELDAATTASQLDGRLRRAGVAARAACTSVSCSSCRSIASRRRPGYRTTLQVLAEHARAGDRRARVRPAARASIRAPLTRRDQVKARPGLHRRDDRRRRATAAPRSSCASMPPACWPTACTSPPATARTSRPTSRSTLQRRAWPTATASRSGCLSSRCAIRTP